MPTDRGDPRSQHDDTRSDLVTAFEGLLSDYVEPPHYGNWWRWLTNAPISHVRAAIDWIDRVAPDRIDRHHGFTSRDQLKRRVRECRESAVAALEARCNLGPDALLTWSKIMALRPTPDPADALTAARGIHA